MCQLVFDPQVLLIIDRPFVVPAIVLLWLFPLAATFPRTARPQVGRLRPFALGAGAAFVLLVLLLRFWLHGFATREPQTDDAFLFSFAIWWPGCDRRPRPRAQSAPRRRAARGRQPRLTCQRNALSARPSRCRVVSTGS
ncbi:MAG: hypothetical protein H0T13_02660 [Actinobacteria bacterium]|nr:hypothetical protein [Actinomycetota bacterium]